MAAFFETWGEYNVFMHSVQGMIELVLCPTSPPRYMRSYTAEEMNGLQQQPLHIKKMRALLVHFHDAVENFDHFEKDFLCMKFHETSFEHIVGEASTYEESPEQMKELVLENFDTKRVGLFTPMKYSEMSESQLQFLSKLKPVS